MTVPESLAKYREERLKRQQALEQSSGSGRDQESDNPLNGLIELSPRKQQSNLAAIAENSNEDAQSLHNMKSHSVGELQEMLDQILDWDNRPGQVEKKKHGAQALVQNGLSEYEQDALHLASTAKPTDRNFPIVAAGTYRAVSASRDINLLSVKEARSVPAAMPRKILVSLDDITFSSEQEPKVSEVIMTQPKEPASRHYTAAAAGRADEKRELNDFSLEQIAEL